jgi:NTP pyrophosphatase (non-canonical NTP hydrolase)
MNDAKTTLKDLRIMVEKLVNEREWQQFHSPKNISMAISIEANELMEKFLWCDTEQSRREMQQNRKEIEEEFADVFITLLLFANSAEIEIAKAVEDKIAKIAQKYPVDKAKGKSLKYDKL